MRAVFGTVALVVVLLIVAVLAKQQMRALQQPMAIASAPVAGASSDAVSTPLNAAEQGRQIQQQVGDSVNQMMKQRTDQLDQQEQK
jgi:hypothetical protein